MKKKSFLRRLILPLIVFICLLSGSFYVTRNIYTSENQKAHETAHSIVESRGRLFLQLLDKRIAVTDTLRALVFDSGWSEERDDSVIQEIFRYTSPMITGIEITQKARIVYTYPEDTSLKNKYIYEDELLQDELVYSMNTQRVLLHIDEETDNLEIYNPIYLRDEATSYEEFYGFAMVKCPYEGILTDARIRELSGNGYNYRLTMHSFSAKKDMVICESDSEWQDENAESYTVEEPGYTFTLSISPANGWTASSAAAVTAVLLTVVAVLAAVLTYTLEKAVESNRLLKQLSSHDNLTGLPNARSFHQQIDLLIENEKPFTVFFMDANHFKYVNDTFGHAAGNEVLMEYAARLSEAFAGKAYRLGGDEFGALVEKELSQDEIQKQIERVDAIMQREYSIKGTPVMFSVSTGWSVYQKGRSYDDMLKEADGLMYEHKKAFHEKVDA